MGLHNVSQPLHEARIKIHTLLLWVVIFDVLKESNERKSFEIVGKAVIEHAAIIVIEVDVLEGGGCHYEDLLKCNAGEV